MQSFLNLIELSTGRQIRLAEFGFKAEAPSFGSDGKGIFFNRDDTTWSFDEDSGMIRRVAELSLPNGSEQQVKINFISDVSDGIGHCELIADGRVVARFMGSEHSIGAIPERDGRIIFIGYPSDDGIN